MNIKTMIQAAAQGRHAAEMLTELHGGLPNRLEWLQLALSNPHKYPSPEWANWLAGASNIAAKTDKRLLPIVLDVTHMMEVAARLKVHPDKVLASHCQQCPCGKLPGDPAACPICQALETERQESLFLFPST
jgi:hypothetical protein